MRCRTVQRRLSALLDGELPRRAAERVTAHLAACAQCAAQWQRLQALRGALEAAPAVKAPSGFARSVVREALRRRQAPDARPVPARGAVRLAAAAAVLAGLALGALAGGTATRARYYAAPGLEAGVETDEASAALLSPIPPNSVTETYLELLAGLE